MDQRTILELIGCLVTVVTVWTTMKVQLGGLTMAYEKHVADDADEKETMREHFAREILSAKTALDAITTEFRHDLGALRDQNSELGALLRVANTKLESQDKQLTAHERELERSIGRMEGGIAAFQTKVEVMVQGLHKRLDELFKSGTTHGRDSGGRG